MSLQTAILITVSLYVSIAASFALLSGCEGEIYALRHQSEEIRLGITRLKEALKI